jgi:hypothetical protein
VVTKGSGEEGKWWRREVTIHNKRIRSYAVDLDEGC